MTAAPKEQPLSQFEQLHLGREIIQAEGRVLLQLARRLDSEFCRTVQLLFACRGSVIVSGMGKAGLIGQKIAATLASTSTRSHFLHPSEAMHGDLGRVHGEDVVIVLSQSGETDEVVRLLPPLLQLKVPLVAITGNVQSTLAQRATVTLDLGRFPEADPLGLAPSSSTTAMLALGDALALVVSRLRGTGLADFARFHPGGSLGRRLSKVEDVMQPLSKCRVASDRLTLRDVFVSVSRPGRRSGAIMMVDDNDVLTGIFTDSDLARLFERKAEDVFDQPISSIMIKSPTTVSLGARFEEAVEILALKRISELPVTDHDGRPIGLIDITDIVGLPPDDCPGTGSGPARVSIPLRVISDTTESGADTSQT